MFQMQVHDHDLFHGRLLLVRSLSKIILPSCFGSPNIFSPVWLVITAVIMKSTIFWDVLPSGQVEVHRCFGDIYYPYLHSRGVSHNKLYLPLLNTDFLLTSLKKVEGKGKIVPVLN
jgi:hypothetical protein